MGFCYQKNFSHPTLPVDEAQFWALVRAKQWNENIDKYRETGEASLKRKLPAFIFQATFDETESAKGKIGRWRKQAATRLTGLVVMDVDHVESEELRVKSEEFAAADFKQRAAELGILLIYITPSGHGLKIVFKARTEWGNLIDNQHAMAKVLGVEVDESCKDASRMSFICKESDILFIDKELFTYENKEFGEKYDAEYRAGHSADTKPATMANKNVKQRVEDGSKVDAEPVSLMWRGYDVQSIIDARYAEKLPCAAIMTGCRAPWTVIVTTNHSSLPPTCCSCSMETESPCSELSKPSRGSRKSSQSAMRTWRRPLPRPFLASRRKKRSMQARCHPRPCRKR